MLFIPAFAEIARQATQYRLPVVASLIESVTEQGFLSWYFRCGMGFDDRITWWLFGGSACVLVALPLSIVSFFRRDYFGMSGLLFSVSAFLGFLTWLYGS
jgi:hypothetical protein